MRESIQNSNLDGWTCTKQSKTNSIDDGVGRSGWCPRSVNWVSQIVEMNHDIFGAHSLLTTLAAARANYLIWT